MPKTNEIATISDTEPRGLEVPADLRNMSTERLRAELSESLKLTADHLVRLAVIVRALEERGEDLSDLRLGLLAYLRRIAHGQVMPELVVRFASSPLLLRYAGALPMPDQRKLAGGEPVPFVSRDADGRASLRLVDPLALSASQVRQVLGPDGLRGEAEQIVLLERSARPGEPTAPPRKVGKVRADRRRVGLIVGKTFVPASLVVEALAQIHVEHAGETRDVQIMATISEREHVALRTAAGRAGTSMASLVRRTLVASGLLDLPEGS